MRALVVIVAAFWLTMGRALAHGGPAPERGISWTFDPWIVTPLIVFGMLYAAGALVLGRRSKRPAGRHRQAVLYWGGWLSLAGSLVSPLHQLGEQLFTFHMIEHEIIMAVSAPLLVLANPVGPLLWALPHRLRITIGRAMRSGVVNACWNWLSQGGRATAIHGIAIWAWHAPALFDAAVTDVAVHRLQHLSFLLSGALFWWSVLRGSGPAAASWHVFITMLHTSALGALIALAPRVLYGAQTAAAASFGLTPLEDQQLAGLIMWVPAATIYAGATLALMAIWIKHAGERTRTGDVAGTV